VIARLTREKKEMIAGFAFLIALGLAQDGVRSLSVGGTALVPPPPPLLGLSIDPRVMRRLLGTRIVVADLIWIDALFKSDSTHESEAFTAFYRAFRNIAILDPDNLYAYYVAGLYLSVIKDDIKGASAILRDGARYLDSHPYTWNEAWRIPYVLAYNLMFEEQELEEGSHWIEKAAAMPNAPLYVRKLAERVSTDAGRLEVASTILTDLYRRVTRPDERAKVEKKLLDIAIRQELAELNEHFRRFLISTSASALPKKKQFQLFLRSFGHSGRDMSGRRLRLDELGRITN
jgi:hypothetical protein